MNYPNFVIWCLISEEIRMKKKLGVVIAFIAILSGLIAIFKLIANVEVAIGFVTISFGILAVIWTSMAVKSSSKGSALRNYTTNFLLCLIFILLFAIWNTFSILFKWRESLNELMLYPSYIFVTLAFLTFVWSSYQILMIGKEFGFGAQASRIEKRIKQKKSKK